MGMLTTIKTTLGYFLACHCLISLRCQLYVPLPSDLHQDISNLNRLKSLLPNSHLLHNDFRSHRRSLFDTGLKKVPNSLEHSLTTNSLSDVSNMQPEQDLNS